MKQQKEQFEQEIRSLLASSIGYGVENSTNLTRLLNDEYRNIHDFDRVEQEDVKEILRSVDDTSWLSNQLANQLWEDFESVDGSASMDDYEQTSSEAVVADGGSQIRRGAGSRIFYVVFSMINTASTTGFLISGKEISAAFTALVLVLTFSLYLEEELNLKIEVVDGN
jgi:hypothetical protein